MQVEKRKNKKEIKVTEDLIDKAVLCFIQQNMISEKINESEKVQMDEGIIGTILGGLAGATLGNKVLTKLCDMLGLKPGTLLYNTLTSKIFSSTIGAFIGGSLTK